MTILLKKVMSALEEALINEKQAMYLIYTYNGLPYPITAKELVALTKLKFIVGNKVGSILYTEESVITKQSGTMLPIYKYELSKEIPKKIASLVAVKAAEGDDFVFPNREKTVDDTAKNYLGGEGLIAYHYLIFLFLFPTEGEYNKRWEKHFLGKFPYKGAPLRHRTKGSATAFKRVVKNRDMGVFLYGTYLFIKSGIQENKTYIKTITNYFLEFEGWYDKAEAQIKKAKSLNELFNNKAHNEGRLNIAI